MTTRLTKRLLVLAATPLVVAGSIAIAQTGPAPGPAPGADDARPIPAQFRGGHGQFGGRGMMLDLFEEVDADGNGSVTQEEIDAFRAAQVQGADASGDGALSLDEFETIYTERVRPMMVDAFQELDEDGDASITAAELDDHFGDVVARLDRNGDGALSLEDHGRGDDRDDDDGNGNN